MNIFAFCVQMYATFFRNPEKKINSRQSCILDLFDGCNLLRRRQMLVVELTAAQDEWKAELGLRSTVLEGMLDFVCTLDCTWLLA